MFAACVPEEGPAQVRVMETEVKGCVCRAASVGAFPTVFPDESWKTYDASEAVHPLRGDAQEAWLDMRVARLIARSHASVLTNLVLYVMVSRRGGGRGRHGDWGTRGHDHRLRAGTWRGHLVGRIASGGSSLCQGEQEVLACWGVKATAEPALASVTVKVVPGAGVAGGGGGGGGGGVKAFDAPRHLRRG